jgi:hypothetical protein
MESLIIPIIITATSMNEIYVTAVGAIKEINSDAVFYTPHATNSLI